MHELVCNINISPFLVSGIWPRGKRDLTYYIKNAPANVTKKEVIVDMDAAVKVHVYTKRCCVQLEFAHIYFDRN